MNETELSQTEVVDVTEEVQAAAQEDTSLLSLYSYVGGGNEDQIQLRQNILTVLANLGGDMIRLGNGNYMFGLSPKGIQLGSAEFDNAVFSVNLAGLVKAAAFYCTGGDISGTSISDIAEGTNLSIQGWGMDMTFTAYDYRKVTWGTGTIKMADGQSFSIAAGDTGNMAAITYIYFDKSVSTTTLQVTTTAANAVGTDKILIAVAQNNSDTTSSAIFQVFGGKGGQIIPVDAIAANSASVNEFLSNTAQIKDAIITNAKIYSMAVDKLTAGTISVAANVGGSNVKIDGGNNRILINDGSYDRILLGYLAGKF